MSTAPASEDHDHSRAVSARVRWTRFAGFVLVVAGVLVLATYLLSKIWEPLQHLWPWFRQLDGPIQFGLGAAAIGAVILICSVVWERWQDWHKEKELQKGRY